MPGSTHIKNIQWSYLKQDYIKHLLAEIDRVIDSTSNMLIELDAAKVELQNLLKLKQIEEDEEDAKQYCKDPGVI